MAPDVFLTARLRLRPIAAEDRDAIFDEYAQDADVVRFLIWRPHRSRDDTAAYIARCLATPVTAGRTYVLTGREDGGVQGAFDLRWLAPHRMEVGYVLARRWWGRGLMTEALTEVADWALREPGVFRVSAFCDVENVGSARVMEKSGLAREGLARRYIVHPNVSEEPRDCFVYALVR